MHNENERFVHHGDCSTNKENYRFMLKVRAAYEF